MTITAHDVAILMRRFHDVVKHKGTAAEQAAFFVHPEPRIFIPHAQDITLQENYEIHQQLTDESFELLEPLDVTPLCKDPERVRVVGAVLWEARDLGTSDPDAIYRVIVGEDWIVQRNENGNLKIALYLNPFHRYMPGSAKLKM